MYIVVIFAYIVIGLYELVPLYRSNKGKDFIANLILVVISFVIAMLISLGFEVPSPEAPIRMLITSFFGK